MAANENKKPAEPANAYEKARQLMEETGKHGLVAPLMKMLEQLLKDPVLKKTMEEMPPTQETAVKPEKKN